MLTNGVSSWWNKNYQQQADLAKQFRLNGKIDSNLRGELDPRGKGPASNGLEAGAVEVGCTSNNQCSSGWACVGGRCQPVQDDSGTTGGISGPGTCDTTEEIEFTTCPSKDGGPDGCQEQPTCGDGSLSEGDTENCCSEERCCSYGSASSSRPGVFCYCGPCPPWPGCTSFCDSYLKANGEPGPGCTEGFEGNSCDSCTECDGDVGGECKPIDRGAPCWCDGGKDCNKSEGCLTCDTNPDSSTLGECLPDTQACQECVTVNHTCCGGTQIPEFEFCQSKGGGGLSVQEAAQQYAEQLCEKRYGASCCAPQCHCDRDCKPGFICGEDGECVELERFGTYNLVVTGFLNFVNITYCDPDFIDFREDSLNETFNFYEIRNVYAARIVDNGPNFEDRRCGDGPDTRRPRSPYLVQVIRTRGGDWEDAGSPISNSGIYYIPFDPDQDPPSNAAAIQTLSGLTSWTVEYTPPD